MAVISKTEEVNSPIFFPLNQVVISDVRTTVAFSRIFSAQLNILVLPEKTWETYWRIFAMKQTSIKDNFEVRFYSWILVLCLRDVTMNEEAAQPRRPWTSFCAK